MKNKHIKLIIIIYLVALTVSTLFYYIIPKNNFVKGQSLKEVEEVKKRGRIIAENIDLLPSKKSDPNYDIQSYEFKYEDKNLEIVKETVRAQIFIGRKNTNDNKIEVYSCKAPTFFHGVEYSDKIKEPKIEMINSILNIKDEKQKYSEYVYVEFPKDFTTTQFYGKETYNSYSGFGGMGCSMVYVKIPKDLVILNDEKFIYIK